MRLFYALVLSLLFQFSAAYDLVRAYQGEHFFDGWDFYGGYDNLTLGNVSFVNRTLGHDAHLTYVGENGNVFLRIDNTTEVRRPLLRNAVYLSTKDSYDVGTVFVMSAVHMPYGCSVWPAFFTQGPTWPDGGEIDILETVNLNPANQMAIHTRQGCYQNGTIDQTGTTTETDCMTSLFEGSGCTVTERSNNSVGANFAQIGGGVYAAEVNADFISIWFFERPDIPQDLLDGDTIDTASWGTPSAYYPGSSCPIGEYFGPQRATLDITLCGNYAGGAIYGQTCDLPAGENSFDVCYDDNIAGDGSNYNTAYWEIEWVKIYGDEEAAASASSAAAEQASSIHGDPSASVIEGQGSGNVDGSGDGDGAALPTASVATLLTLIPLLSAGFFTLA